MSKCLSFFTRNQACSLEPCMCPFRSCWWRADVTAHWYRLGWASDKPRLWIPKSCLMKYWKWSDSFMHVVHWLVTYVCFTLYYSIYLLSNASLSLMIWLLLTCWSVMKNYRYMLHLGSYFKVLKLSPLRQVLTLALMGQGGAGVPSIWWYCCRLGPFQNVFVMWTGLTIANCRCLFPR